MKLLEQEQKHVEVVPSSGAAGSHIPALDGLRGIAILLVLVFHFDRYGNGLPFPSVLADTIFMKFSQAGWMGVDLFFVLSGFLITGILYDSKESDHYFRNFYARRCLRIFPLYYAALVLFLIILPWLFSAHAGLQSIKENAFWYWTYLSNLRSAYTGWHWFGAVNHFWSLAVEEQFYFVWPFVILFFKRRTLLRVCLALILGAVLVRVLLCLAGYTIAAYVLMPARMDALATGAFVALACRGPHGFARLANVAWPTASLMGVVLALIFVWRGGLFAHDVIFATIGYTLLAIFFGSILVLALVSTPSSILGRLFTSSGMTFFGRYSYALYVFHHPILFFIPGSLALSRIPKVLGSRLPAELLFIALATIVTVSIALLSWHLCEKQSLKLKRFFPYHSRKIQAAAVSLAPEQVPSITPG